MRRSKLFIDADFRRFHRKNPQIFREIVQRAENLINAGALRIGMGAIFESMRYDIAVRTLGDEFKLNNNFRSRYTRLLLRKRPEFKGFLATRALAEK